MAQIVNNMCVIQRPVFDPWVRTKHGPWRRKWQMTPIFLLQEPHERMKRQNDMTPENESPGQKVSDMLLGKSREIAPERGLGQS